MDDRAVDRILEGHVKNLGAFDVVRSLPVVGTRNVGPFVFFDHFGPTELPPAVRADVRPHPHIGLATVSYLYEGAMMHRDNLGSVQRITPGDVNWMTAGRGIVHSERMPDEVKEKGGRLHGLQLWVALPVASAEVEPAFVHHPKETLPVTKEGRAEIKVLVGSAYGVASPVAVHAPTFYADFALPDGESIELPTDVVERGIYVVSGELRMGDRRFVRTAMVVLRKGERAIVHAHGAARFVVIGGDPLDGPRTIWWNFVSHSKERIEQAKADWRDRKFPAIPGDDDEFIPLPDV
ncbi:MAG: pirin family protein [Polyangiaceae bacterium]